MSNIRSKYPVSKLADVAYNKWEMSVGENMRLCEMREKEVINLCNCKRLGCVSDLIFDECSGCIEAIIVPGPGKFCGLFGGDSEFVIPFECIKKIGPDIIMVEICEEKFLKRCKD